jgi:hypothetical protein
MAALHAATAEPADHLGAAPAASPRDHAADLVVDANPLHDIRDTRCVAGALVPGRYLDSTALDRLLRDVEATAAAIPATTVPLAGCACHTRREDGPFG